jgi:6-phosphogluconolactonase
MKTPRSAATSFALALLLAIGTTAICAAKTFVYVSNALDGNIDAYTMDTSTGSLTPIGKAEAGKLVMPMAVSPDKKHLYAVVRSQPPRVLTYAIDPTTGALTQKASAPLPDSMPSMSRPIAPGATCSPPPMAATNSR